MLVANVLDMVASLSDNVTQMPIQGAALVFDGGAETWSRRLGLLLAVLSFVVRPTRWCLCRLAR